MALLECRHSASAYCKRSDEAQSLLSGKECTHAQDFYETVIEGLNEHELAKKVQQERSKVVGGSVIRNAFHAFDNGTADTDHNTRLLLL